MALKLQYKHSHQRSKTLPMPIELLVDIFRSLNTTKEIAPSFTSDNFNATSNKNKYVRLRNFNRLKIWWELQVEDLLTSSAIIYIVARNAFLNRKKVGIRISN
uniref:F-box domain-containing protein n=1 Tax=Meloidogyne hapla TaxID=6305 RepID=A0A1I8B682_MELHA